MTQAIGQLKSLCRGEAGPLASQVRDRGSGGGSAWLWLAAVVAGSGAYGFTIGLWRDPLQGACVAVKMPLLIVMTLSINGLLNGMLAQVLESGLRFRETFTAILQSFAIFSMIVGSLSPVALFFDWSAGRAGSAGGAQWYRLLLLIHTAVIALAGVVANVRLLRLLETLCGEVMTARRVLTAWLAGNLFVGAQLSYNLRPFFGNPDLPVQFLRPHPFHGNFYESLWRLTRSALNDFS